MLKHQDSQHKRTVKFKRMRELINVTKQHKLEYRPMLPIGFAEEWADALESGDYEQGNYHLYDTIDDGGQYCCLGVACVLLGVKRDHIVNEGMPIAIYKQRTGEYDAEGYSIREQIRIPSALQSSDGEDDLASVGDALALCNDSGWTFKSLAMFIRRYLG